MGWPPERVRKVKNLDFETASIYASIACLGRPLRADVMSMKQIGQAYSVITHCTQLVVLCLSRFWD